MKLLFSTLALSIALLPIYSFAITDTDVAEVTERLEAMSTSELVQRKKDLEANLDDEDISEDERKAILFELSIVEQLLILAGVIIAGDVTDSTSPPPDSIFPIITILGSNPATVELGSIYADAGATTNEEL